MVKPNLELRFETISNIKKNAPKEST